MSMGKRGRIQELWDVDVGADILVAPLIADINNDGEQEIIIGTKDGRVVCLRQNGQALWQFSTQHKMGKVEKMFLDAETAYGISCKPVVLRLAKQSIIVVGTDIGMVYGISAQGQMLWKFETGGGIFGGFFIGDISGNKNEEIAFGSKDGGLYVLNSSGKTILRIDNKSGIKSAPFFHKEKKQLYVGDENGNMHSYALNGKEIWSFSAEGGILGAPSIGNLFGTDEEHLVFGTADGKVYAITIDGIPRWEFQTEGAVVTKPCLIDFNGDKKLEVVIGCSDSNVYTLNAIGEKIWSYESNFWINADPIVYDIDDDKKLEVIVGSYDHYVYVLDVEADYELDYMPGISGVVHQSGSYTEVQTAEPGDHVAKKIWSFKTKGIIMGMSLNKNNNLLVLTTKNGHVTALTHIKR